ncbi:hypothetical protein B0H67DRAFT_650453 [Lasiosphaeris hirsuta]|uniref:Uncharacterized protein n=1 Tax=Lasiosphaeris hirsuta TaxID=260670 RepID=A0AA40DH59_9PEZI|nr:hypothetical protein B0H67DRAFT_650453 [Lasiosphaeris hirsuta]
MSFATCSDGQLTQPLISSEIQVNQQQNPSAASITSSAAGKHGFHHHLNPTRPIRWIRRIWASFFTEDREVPKVVIRQGFFHWPLFKHLWIHLIPCLATAAVLGLNLWQFDHARLRGYYIGETIPGDFEDETKLDWLQFAAKLHEISIVASLGTVVWDMVRYFLVYKPLGVPLGLVGAGSAFMELKFLFSKELHGIWRMDYGMGTKISVFLAITLFCLMANLVGPSSAILLIPRNYTWPVAEYQFSINGTADSDLWPRVLTAAHIGGANCRGGAAAIASPGCVAGAYPPIAHYFRSFTAYPFGGSFEFSATDSRTSRMLHGNTRNKMTHYSETWTMAPHAASVLVHEELRLIWSNRLNDVPLNYRNAFLRTVRADTTGPAVRTACSPARNLSASVFTQAGADMFPLYFPVLQEDRFWVPYFQTNGFGGGPIGRVHLNASLLDLPPRLIDGRNLVVKTTWVSLPNGFGAASTGLLILMSAADQTGPHGVRFELGMGPTGRGPPTGTRPRRRGSGGARPPPTTPAACGPGWLRALTPAIPGRAGNATTLDALFEDTVPNEWAVAEHPSIRQCLELYHSPYRVELVVLTEHIVATLVADGLARLGLGLQAMIWDLERPIDNVGRTRAPYQDLFSLGGVALPPPYNSPDGTQLVMTTEVAGYGLRLEGLSGVFAAVVLGLHLLFVIIHLVFVFWVFRGQTMGAWESLTEFLLLALASSSAKEFDEDTREMLSCGGVGAERATTFARLVRIESSSDGGSPGQEVRLRLGKGGDRLERLEPGRVYGKPHQ